MKQNQLKNVLKPYEKPCMEYFAVQAVAPLATSQYNEPITDTIPECGGELGAKASGGFDGDIWE